MRDSLERFERLNPLVLLPLQPTDCAPLSLRFVHEGFCLSRRNPALEVLEKEAPHRPPGCNFWKWTRIAAALPQALGSAAKL